MDTRRKILTPQQALETASALRASGEQFTLLSGYFDVLQPALLKQISTAQPARIFALILDPPAPLLSAQARAELAASLQVIDYVIYSSSENSEFIASLAPDHHIRAEAQHLATRERLIQHVLERHALQTGQQPAARRQSH